MKSEKRRFYKSDRTYLIRNSDQLFWAIVRNELLPRGMLYTKDSVQRIGIGVPDEIIRLWILTNVVLYK